MATVWTTMEKNADGRFAETGFHMNEPEKWYRFFTVNDPEDFIAHMKRFHSLPKKALSRDAYEAVCQEVGVKPATDQDLEFYGTTYSTIGTSNYHLHTEPENREAAIANALHTLRYREIRKTQV